MNTELIVILIVLPLAGIALLAAKEAKTFKVSFFSALLQLFGLCSSASKDAETAGHHHQRSRSLWEMLIGVKNPITVVGLPDEENDVNEKVSAMLNTLNCRFTTEEHNDSVDFHYRYQSGNFIVRTTRRFNVIDVVFPEIIKVPIDRLELLRSLCNKESSEYLMAKAVYSIDAEAGQVSVFIMVSLYMGGSIVALTNMLDTCMQICFAIRDSLSGAMEKWSKAIKDYGIDDIERYNVEHERDLSLLATLESAVVGVNPPGHVTPPDDFTPAAVMEAVADWGNLRFVRLDVMTDDVKSLTDAGAIASYDLTAPFAADPALSALTARLVVVPEADGNGTERSVTLSLTRRSIAGETHCLDAIVTLPPERTDSQGSEFNASRAPKAVALTVAAHTDSVRKRQAEFDFIWQEAKDKVATGRRKELTNDERLIVDVTEPRTAHNIYWGYVLMRRGCFFTAARHLEDALADLNERYDHMNEREHTSVHELHYKTGLCYACMGLYQRAYRYFDAVLPANNTDNFKAYINCIVALHDFRALSIINAYLERIKAAQDEDDGSLPNDNKAVEAFLRRSRAIVLINKGDYDAAEADLNRMIDDNDNADFALTELARIQRLRSGADTGSGSTDASAAPTEPAADAS